MAVLPEALPNATTTYMAGQNHLVPVERPDLVASETADALKALHVETFFDALCRKQAEHSSRHR